MTEEINNLLNSGKHISAFIECMKSRTEEDVISAKKILKEIKSYSKLSDDYKSYNIKIKSINEEKQFAYSVSRKYKNFLNQIENNTFDVVITDQRMPEMSGLELLAAVSERGLDLPVIMITAYGTINQAVEAIQAGAADFIPKPFSAEDLERVIERVLAPEAKTFQHEGSRASQKRPAKSRKQPVAR